ncbi:hypothetical protein LTS17_006505 [Exophiala oligosperma]
MGELSQPFAASAHIFEYPELKVGTDEPYKILGQYHSKPRKLRIATVGAGASGLCIAYKMNKMLDAGSWELTLFDKNPHFGGTWYENTYPGCACDVPSQLYTYTFDPKPDWSYFYAYSDEIQRYFEDFADRHDLRKYIKLSTKVIEARWIDSEAIWKIKLENQVTKEVWEDWSHILINAAGILNNWRWPDIKDLHSFKGPMMHTAAWDHTVDLTDKIVGLIGTGSSSVQVLPQIQKIAKEVQVFMRSPTWISPPLGGNVLKREVNEEAMVNLSYRQYKFSEADIKHFRDDPQYHLHFRQEIEAELNKIFGVFIKGSEMNNNLRKVVTEEMNRRMGPGHEELKKFIIPKFSPGCRRLTPGDGYLEALVQPNVTPVYGGITKGTEQGLLTADGVEHKLDVLICATGFKAAFQPAFTVINGEGKSIKEDWGEDGVNLYFGVTAPRFPNFFTVVGPGATWSNGTLLPSVETTVEYILKVIRKIQRESIKSMATKQEALDDIFAHMDELHKTTVWGEECRSWFKDGKKEGRIYIWPGSAIHFLKTMKEPRFEDYDITYRYKNRFAYLGDGSVKSNYGGTTQDLAPYIRSSDHEWTIE